ncbi:MAG: glutamate-5-semialdehyde dehydrogenase [Magnetococcales bacterium]|nr:glutamate-5-semialdehyde dehydrogenase [Magnetococcales bacterium]
METSRQVNVAAMAKEARQAARVLAMADGAVKNKALLIMAVRLLEQSAWLQEENNRDLQAAEAAGLSSAMIDRLRLNESRIAAMAEGVRQVAALDDPVGEITALKARPNGMRVGKMRVPLGVIGVIYESRPNVTADAAALCVKSGNAVILRGGSEAYYSNRAISACLMHGLQEAGLPMTAVQYIDTTDRAAVGELLRCDADVDVIIPRGGKDLIARIIAESHIPVIKHLDGICHTYVDAEADLAMALALTMNGKMQRTGVCNATETLLVHRAVAATFLPEVCQQLAQAGCQLRVCPETRTLLPAQLAVQDARAEDWDTEYLDAILSIRVVASLEEAIDHIERHSSRHTDVIVTRSHGNAMRFLREVDSASVMVNASSRFSDGFEFGLGAEMGISTDKLHVRGPVGLEGLTTQKYIVLGDGQLRR